MMKNRVATATEIVGKGEDGKAYEDMEMAIKALEKQMPRKTVASKQYIRINMYEGTIRPEQACPCCGKVINEEKFCPNCGQAISG